jgi:hypothetical protein
MYINMKIVHRNINNIKPAINISPRDGSGSLFHTLLSSVYTINYSNRYSACVLILKCTLHGHGSVNSRDI